MVSWIVGREPQDKAEKSAYIYAGEGKFQLSNQEGCNLAYEGGDGLDGTIRIVGDGMPADVFPVLSQLLLAMESCQKRRRN